MSQTGFQLKEYGQAVAIHHESGAWLDQAEWAISVLARKPFPFTAEDVRKIAGDPERVNSMGAVLSAAKKKGLIEVDGYALATRPEGHARLMRRWRGSGA